MADYLKTKICVFETIKATVTEHFTFAASSSARRKRVKIF